MLGAKLAFPKNSRWRPVLQGAKGSWGLHVDAAPQWPERVRAGGHVDRGLSGPLTPLLPRESQAHLGPSVSCRYPGLDEVGGKARLLCIDESVDKVLHLKPRLFLRYLQL